MNIEVVLGLIRFYKYNYSKYIDRMYERMLYEFIYKKLKYFVMKIYYMPYIMQNSSYKKLSHFEDMVKNMSNEPDKNNPYSDKQFEEDLIKWRMESKKIQNDKFIEFIENYKNGSGK